MARKLSIIVVVAAVLLLLVLIATWPQSCFRSTRPEVRPDSVEEEALNVPAGVVAGAPITLVATSGGADLKHTWHLSVNSAGQAELTGGRGNLLFQIPQDDWD